MGHAARFFLWLLRRRWCTEARRVRGSPLPALGTIWSCGGVAWQEPFHRLEQTSRPLLLRHIGRGSFAQGLLNIRLVVIGAEHDHRDHRNSS